MKETQMTTNKKIHDDRRCEKSREKIIASSEKEIICDYLQVICDHLRY